MIDASLTRQDMLRESIRILQGLEQELQSKGKTIRDHVEGLEQQVDRLRETQKVSIFANLMCI